MKSSSLISLLGILFLNGCSLFAFGHGGESSCFFAYERFRINEDLIQGGYVTNVEGVGVLTALHLIQKERALQVWEASDLALVEGEGFSCGIGISEEKAEHGDSLYSCETGDELGVLKERRREALVVSAQGEPKELGEHWISDLPVAPGESGKPLCDAKGDLMMMVSAQTQNGSLLVNLREVLDPREE